MSLDDSQQEDCTVYIEELKSDNPSLKVGAASKLPVIAGVLGHNRIRDELVPYLVEIIEQMDNQNEFLVKIAQGLFELKAYCKDPSQSYILLPPLKILASLDQPSVRQKAVESIIKLCEGLNSDFYCKYIYPLIIEMSDKNKSYSPRVSSCMLIPACYPEVSQKQKGQLQKIFKRLGVDENSPLVRRAVAENLEAYTKVVGKSVSKTDGLEIWQKFIVDKIDIVRIKALETAIIMVRFFKKDEIGDKFFKYIKLVDPQKKSWRIRYSLIECINSLLPYLEKDLIKKDSVEIFQELLKDNEAEVRAITILKMPELAQKLSHQQSFNVFFQYAEKASKDTSINVKLALVENIDKYIGTLDEDKKTDSGVTLLMGLIKDQNPSVRIEVVKKLKDLSEVLGEENTQKYLLPMVENCINDKKWRFKLAVAESLKGLFKSLDSIKHKGFMDKIVKAFMKDHYYAVREQAINSLAELKNHLGAERIKQIFGDSIKSLMEETNCVYRVTACLSLKQVCSALNKNQFNELFSFFCKVIQNEKVPNVIISFLQNYQKVKGSLTSECRKDFSKALRKVREIKDEDVQYFANKIQQ